MKRTFKTVDDDQSLDLTVRLGDCLPPDHLARFVVDSVAQLDLSALYAHYGTRGGEPYALSSIGFLGGREGKDRRICYDEEMNVSLIMKEKACVLPRSIIVMGAGSVNRLRAFEQSAGARVSALECRNSLDRQ